MDVREAWTTVPEGKLVMKGSGYPEAQHRHFARFQGQPVTVVEIGVAWGGSLHLWRSYFGEQATIIGVDIDPNAKRHADDRIHVEIGDQADPGFLAELAERWGPFDVVMDDGGHTMAQQITTFEVLFPHVRPGGVYQCEDVESSYMLDRYPQFGPEHGPHRTFMELMKSKVDEINGWHIEPTEFTRTAASMHFYAGLVFVERAEMVEPTFMFGSGGKVDYKTFGEVTGG